MSKLKRLLEIEGMTLEQALEQSMYDGVSPAICMNGGCDNTTEMEPDQNRGWCDECETNSMKSVCILAGVI